MNPNPHPSGGDRDRGKLMTLAEAADYLRTPVATLYWWRHNHIGPPSFKIGRKVMYWQADIDDWIAAQCRVGGTA